MQPQAPAGQLAKAQPATGALPADQPSCSFRPSQSISINSDKKEGKPFKLIYDITDNLWSLSADKAQLTQVLLTLLTNAVQASPSGEEITLKAHNIELADVTNIAPGPYLKISVIDHGEGIISENLSKIFDPYFTTRRAHHGLGLALAYSIINNHGVHIEIVSEPGQDSTFSVYLPANPLTATTPNLKILRPL